MTFPGLAHSRRRKIVIVALLAGICLVIVGLYASQEEDSNHLGDNTISRFKSQKAKKLLSRERNSRRQRTHNMSGAIHDEWHAGSKKRNVSAPEHKDSSELETGVKMAATDEEGGFDTNKVLSLFSSCRGDDNILSLDCYVDAYQELCKLFQLFGTIFSFVSSDVEEKIGILREFRQSEHAEKYKTVQSMLNFEVEKEITALKKKPSGARTLLRLHRALEFISALLIKIRDTDNDVKFSSQAVKAYDDTLAKYHPWLVKKAVHVAMYMLPSRPNLLKKMSIEDSEKGKAAMTDLINELNGIYDITQELYVKLNLLDLP